MKRLFFKLGMIVAMLLSFLTVYPYDFEVDGIYYNILEDKTCVSVTYRNTSYDTYTGNVVIPQSVEYNDVSYDVTEIGYRAFFKSTTVTTISIPSSLKKIGLYAFQDANHIQKVYITDLSAWCMMELDSFYSSPLAYGGSLILNGQSVISLDELNDSCTKIGKYAFYGNTFLRNVVIPDNIEFVEAGAFRGCSGMEYLEVGANVVSLGEGAFKGCSKLETIKFKDSSKTIKLGRYETNRTYRYFKDSPLNTVYAGRIIDWEDDGYNYTSYYPFNTVKTAIFNVNNSHMASAFTALTDVYIGPDCHEFSIYKTLLINLYVFNNDITKAFIDSNKTKVYVIDKTNVPQKIADLKSVQIFNLLEVENRPTNQSYEYGSLPNLSADQFISNVESMNIRLDEELPKTVGVYNQGINITLYNSLWDAVINVPFTYAITPAKLTVIPENVVRKYGDVNPKLSCSFFGFKNNETVDVLTRQPNVETTANVNSPVGTYPIIATGAEAQNYSFNYERGTLTITRANQEIEWNQTFGTVNVGDVIELTATSTSGLPVKYTVTDESIAEIYSQGGKKYVEFLRPGSVSIRATQEGNENYNEADRVNKNVVVASLVKEVILNQTSVNINEGESYQLKAVVNPSDALNKRLEWTSSNNNVATVDETGKVSAIKQGKATISAITTDGSNITVNCEVTVLKQVSGIVLNITSASLAEGQTLQISALVSPDAADNKKLQWNSGDDKIATVSETGLVTAVAQGEVIISAISTDGSDIEAKCSIHVVKLVNSIVLDKTSATLNEGQTLLLKATVSPELADNKSLAWSSSNESIAIVSETGLVTAKNQGNVVITVATTDGSNLSASCDITVNKLVAEITLNEIEATLNEGQTVQLQATVKPYLANNKKIVWSTSNESIAIVDQNGLVSAVNKGIAVITATSIDGSNISAICTIKVRKLVSDITLNQTEVVLYEGQSAQLSASVTPELADNKEIEWTSSDGKIVSVDQDGRINAISQGTATITVRSMDGSDISASCNVTVRKFVSGIILDETSVSLNEGENIQLSATVVPELADNKTLIWSSSNASVASVTQDGLVTAIKKGHAYIIVTANDGSGASASCEITVHKLVSNITLNETEVALNEGQSFQLNATISPDNADNKALEWSSSNPSVVKVDANGFVTAIAQGNAIITVFTTDGSNLSATCEVEVYREQVLVSSISLNPNLIEGDEDTTSQIIATVLPNDADNKELSWSSSDTEIATVDNSGFVTLKSKGTTTITVISTDGSDIKAECMVIVSEKAGINDILIDKDTHVRIYTLTGVMIYDGEYSLSNLTSGTYIVVTDGKAVKQVIK